MEEFQKMGFTWFARKYEIKYKFPVELGDCVVVKTWVEKAGKMSVDVGFEMQSKKTGRMATKGLARFVLIDIHTDRPAKIPEDVIEKYSV
jgi:acyl-CoA thioesterase FadM